MNTTLAGDRLLDALQELHKFRGHEMSVQFCSSPKCRYEWEAYAHLFGEKIGRPGKTPS